MLSAPNGAANRVGPPQRGARACSNGQEPVPDRVHRHRCDRNGRIRTFETMDDDSDTDDWLAGGQIGVSAGNLSFFDGQCVQLDPSRLPDPPDEPGVA
jgi:hypothetical protein